MKTHALYVAGAALMIALSSCDRDLDLAHAYNNGSSSKPYEFDADFNPDDYTDFGTFVVGDRNICWQDPHIPRYMLWLDGKISVGKYDDSGLFTTYWSADNSLQQVSASPWLEENVNALTSDMEVFGKCIEPVSGFYDGGAWFIGVHKLMDGRLAGFFHAESHWPGVSAAYKSIGVTYSSDNGLTWETGRRILSGTDPKPENPAGQGESYGLGDGCVVWNDAHKVWICYYSGYCDDPGNYMITMACSEDPAGAAGTWKKWDGKAFTVEGCNGRVKRYKWYSIQVYLGKDTDGKKVYRRFSGRDKNELLRQIAQAEAELKETKEKSETKTLGEALEEYIVSRTAVCSPSTIRGYRSVQRNALSELQNRPIDEISQIELQKFMNEYAKTHSPKTCRNVHGLLSSILQNNRPGFTIKTTLPQKELSDIYVPDEKEISQIAELIRGNPLEIPFLLATQCGLRESEITALNISNVHDDYIMVTEAYVLDENGVYQKKAPKSYAGYRKIPISKAFANILCKAADEDGRVVAMRSINICNNWIRFRDKNGFDENMNFHALRHHYASKCLLIGMPQKYIAEIMGHSSTRMIEQVYQHVFGSAMEEYANKIRNKMDDFCKNYSKPDNTIDNT